MGPLIVKIKIISFSFIVLLNFSLAIFVYLKNAQSKTHRYLSLTALFSGIYSLSYVLIYLTLTYPMHQTIFSPLFWGRFAYVGAFILPPMALFILYFFQDNPPNIKLKKILFYTPAFAIFILSVTTPLILKDAVIFDYNIKGAVGPLDSVARLYFTIMLFLVGYYLIKGYKTSEGRKKLQIKYFIFGTFVYVICGGIPISILPLVKGAAVHTEVTCFFSSIWVFWVVYAIIRYRLMDIDTVIHRTILWIATSLWLILPAYALFKVSRPWLEKMNNFWLTMFALCLFYVFLWYYRYFQPKIDHAFRRKKYDYSQILGMLSLSLKGVLDIEKISQEVSTSLKEALYLKKIGIIIQDINTENLLPLIQEGFETGRLTASNQDSLVTFLKGTAHLEPEQIEVNPKLFFLKKSPLYQFLKKEDIPLVVSLSFEDDFIGFIVLGKKQNLQSYTLRDIDILVNISSEVSLYFYNALHHEDILEKQRLQQEITLAKNIQENLLPIIPPQIPGLALYGLYAPSKEIGGDYYDFILAGKEIRQRYPAGTGNQRLYITIGDVSGKGLDAGLVVSSVKSSLLSLIKFLSSPRDILLFLNDIIFTEIKEQKFVSLLLLMYDHENNVMRYSSCGHEHILIYRKESGVTSSREVEVIKSGGIILGMLEDIESMLEENHLNLKTGDKILLYTDGVTEARNPEEQLYGRDRLVKSFQSHAHLALNEMIHNVHTDITKFISTRDQFDDITLVGIEKQ